MPDPTLYLSQPKIELGGQAASPELMKDLLQITVEESLHLPAMFTLVVHNSYMPTVDRAEYKPWRHENLFEIGKKIKIGFTSSTTQDGNFQKKLDDYLIEAEITAMEVHFNEKSEAHMIIRGYDISHRLHRGRYNRSFLNKTDSDIVKDIASEAGIGIEKIEPSGEVHEYVFQENQTNMEFLRERAARIGFELFIQNNKLYFRKPESQESIKLKWLVDISKFSTRVTSAEQVSSVEVRGWDYTQKQAIASTAKAEKVITETGNNKGSSSSTKFANLKAPKMTVVDQPIATPNQAQKMAQALCDELGGEFVYADAKAVGNPKVRPGKVIEIEGLGKRYSGKYYVTETRHFYTQRIYTTEFSIRGLRAGNLFTTLSSQTRLQPGQTFLVGIVTDNKDPKGLGRVKVKFPTLTEEHASHWARIVAAGAGNQRGFDCLPEINDEVLVGFEHGDIHRPYILGGVWNGKDAPPEGVNDTVVGGKVRLRTVKTRTGHTLQFVEEAQGSSKAGVRVQTKGGHKIYLNDSDRCIEIQTNGGHKIKMDDQGKAKITVESTGDLSLNAPKGNIEITAGMTVTVKGTLIKLN
ncbi:VgrG-related protein [Calothrix sp. FACHB-1219]|uniref:VgrG-related protein n=1 Tax=unclassified Calothrix TaxID=2619626 RepID=UPI00168755CB|nr:MULTISPECIES: VgrG-related protein [unclassified Calothrix]MBD2207058.1 VgrG-related protein [Calothrix sp. FACHB-168]MBD2221674.1 VgrG-related protein [Calothrix sp. FACHB-1219]